MAKKIILSALILIILVVGGGYFGRNVILKSYLVRRINKVTGGETTIGNVNFKPFDNFLGINNIKVSTKNDKNKNLVSIENVKVDYLLSFSTKELEITNASIFGAKLSDNENEEGIPKAESIRKEASSADTLQLTNKKAINQELENLLSSQYNLFKENLKLNEEQIKKDLDQIEKSSEFEETKKIIEEILNSKNPLVIFEKNSEELQRIKNSVKNLADSFKRERKKADDLLKNYDIDFEGDMNDRFKSYIAMGKEGIRNFDFVLNEYLNEEHEPKLYQGVLAYKEFIQEVKKFKVDKTLSKDNWKIDIKSLLLTLNAYGMDFNGEITGVSNRFSEKVDDVNFRLVAIEAPGENDTTATSVNNGVIEGKLSLNDLYGQILVNIPNGKLENFDNVQDYVSDGSFGLNATIILNDENVNIVGNGNLQNMQLTSKVFSDKLKLDFFLLEEAFLSIIKEINVENVKYSYDSSSRKVEVITNLGQRFLAQLDSNDGQLEKEIFENLKNSSQEKIKEYKELIEKDKYTSREAIEKELNLKSKDIEKMNKVLDKIRMKDKKGILDKILEKFD